MLICSDGHSGKGGRVSIRPRPTRTFSALGAASWKLRVSPSQYSKGLRVVTWRAIELLWATSSATRES